MCHSVQDLGQDWPLLANCCYCVLVSQSPLISFDLNLLPEKVEGCLIGCFNLIVESLCVVVNVECGTICQPTGGM